MMNDDSLKYYLRVKEAARLALENKDSQSVDWKEVAINFAEIARDLADDQIKLFEGLDKVEEHIKKVGDAIDAAQEALS